MSVEEEIEVEQVYFDRALEVLESSLRTWEDAAGLMANAKDRQPAIRQAEAARKRAAPAFEEGAAFGRIDLEDEAPVYVGKVSIIERGADEPLVRNWQTPAGTLFYEASHEDPKGVVSKRQYRAPRNVIEWLDEVHFRQLAEDVAKLEAPDLDDALLADLARHRDGEMRDIVRTIRAAQHRVIRGELDQTLVVQGGPGTGKTAVALHRVSWLLFNHQKQLGPEDVLVVGPSTTFIKYIRAVLPSLGDEQVSQSALDRLGPGSGPTDRGEEPGVAKLKGEQRMEGLLERGLWDRVSVPDGVPLGSDGVVRVTTRVRDRDYGIDREALAREVERLRRSSYGSGRQGLRDFVRSELAGIVASELLAEVADGLVERVWPQLSPNSFLQDLLGSKERLLRAAGEQFSAREVEMLYRRSAPRLSDETWSQADVALLDFAHFLLVGDTRKYRHIVVDEAQDLSPMQLGSLARRSTNGSMTILGDIAQSTGAWARDSWDDVIAALTGDLPTAIVELEVGYRVPREVFAVAAKLLPSIAPGVTGPRVIREGATAHFQHVDSSDDRAAAAVEHASHYAGLGRSVGIICPDGVRGDIATALDALGARWDDGDAGAITGSIVVISPERSKGLEFDVVVVVEPEAIVGSERHGGRLLYVAFTRTTGDLVVIHQGASMRNGLTAPTLHNQRMEPDYAGKGSHGPIDETREVSRVVEAIARSLADEVRSSVQPSQWPILLDELRRQLEED